MKNIFRAVLIIGVFIVSPVLFAHPTEAAGLTQAQINTIVDLLRSFSVDAGTITSVQTSLGNSTTNTNTNTATSDRGAGTATGSIHIRTTLNGSEAQGGDYVIPFNVKVIQPNGVAIQSFATSGMGDYGDMPAGTYSLSYVDGAPAGYVFSSLNGNYTNNPVSQTLSAHNKLVYTFNFTCAAGYVQGEKRMCIPAGSAAACPNVPQTPVACSGITSAQRTQYGIPEGATSGNASYTKNSCTGALIYTGGCDDARGTSRADTARSMANYYCPSISSNLASGASNASAGGQVSELQKFLASYYSINTQELVTGFFGTLTQGLVQRFQREQGLEVTSSVGPLTRTAIMRRACPSVARDSDVAADTANTTGTVNVRYFLNNVLQTAPITVTVDYLFPVSSLSNDNFPLTVPLSTHAAIGNYRVKYKSNSNGLTFVRLNSSFTTNYVDQQLSQGGAITYDFYFTGTPTASTNTTNTTNTTGTASTTTTTTTGSANSFIRFDGSRTDGAGGTIYEPSHGGNLISTYDDMRQPWLACEVLGYSPVGDTYAREHAGWILELPIFTVIDVDANGNNIYRERIAYRHNTVWYTSSGTLSGGAGPQFGTYTTLNGTYSAREGLQIIKKLVCYGAGTTGTGTTTTGTTNTTSTTTTSVTTGTIHIRATLNGAPVTGTHPITLDYTSPSGVVTQNVGSTAQSDYNLPSGIHQVAYRKVNLPANIVFSNLNGSYTTNPVSQTLTGGGAITYTFAFICAEGYTPHADAADASGLCTPAAGTTTNTAGTSGTTNTTTCTNVPQTPVSCSSISAADRSTYGIPAGATSGNASYTKNSCTGVLVYTGGCSVPVAATQTGTIHIRAILNGVLAPATDHTQFKINYILPDGSPVLGYVTDDNADYPNMLAGLYGVSYAGGAPASVTFSNLNGNYTTNYVYQTLGGTGPGDITYTFNFTN